VVALGCPIKSQHYYGKLMQLIRTSETAWLGCKTTTFFVLAYIKIKPYFPKLSSYDTFETPVFLFTFIL